AAEQAIVKVAAAIDHVEEADIAQRRPHLDGIDLARRRHRAAAAQILPIAQEEAELRCPQAFDRRRPMDLGTAPAFAAEDFAEAIDLAGRNRGAPGVDPRPVEIGDAASLDNFTDRHDLSHRGLTPLGLTSGARERTRLYAAAGPEA